MQKYTCKYWLVLSPLVKKSIKRHYGSTFASSVMKKAKTEYKVLLNKIDDIGADNPMASNIYMSFVFFAVYRAADGKITVNDLRITAREVMEWKLLKCVGAFIDLNKPGDIDSMRKKMLKNAEWLEKHSQYKKVSWDFNFDDNKHRDGYYYHFTQCPLNDFARREGLLEVLPVMCEMDHMTAGLMHAKLHRENTLAGGGEMCDYWFVGDKMKDPR
jgi:hypothetical protein